MNAIPVPAAASGRRRWLPWLVLGLGVAVTLGIALTWRPAPVIPADPDHARAADPQACLVCHGLGRPQARPPQHPISEACFSCHRRP